MISAKKDRDGTGSRQLIGARTQCPGPALDFPVVLDIVRRGVSKVGHIANWEIAVVFYFKAESVKQGQKTGRSQGGRPHQGAALRRSNIDGGTKHRNSFG